MMKIYHNFLKNKQSVGDHDHKYLLQEDSSIDKKSCIEKAPSGIIIGWSENNAGIGVYRDRYFYDLLDDGTRIIDLADQILAVAVRKLYEGGSAQGLDFDKLDIMTLA